MELLLLELELLIDIANELREKHGITTTDIRVEDACDKYLDTYNACRHPSPYQFTPEMQYYLISGIYDAITSVIHDLQKLDD